ncbi:MAG TPA: PC4/YdbC family ssDNA-binding protein, partial [Elusimicrobiales bacterium]|nr:PC4/YdbC family ssDNA-binding protein [Elusimicrobiales bacterium]
MPADEFKVLKDIGVLPSTEGSEIRFSIDEYRGYKYGSIRKYLKRESYSGPTRAGITMSRDIVSGVLGVLSKLTKNPSPSAERELGKFAKRP